MKVLVVGSGGREHALAWKLMQSTDVEEVLVAPGNAGTQQEPGVRNVEIAVTDTAGLITLCQRENIDFTVVGPEVPLVAGIVDAFAESSLACFGPTAQAAQLEGSKAFSKAFMRRHQIPTAAHETFSDAATAKTYVRAQGAPIVIKADGLAAGKGVIVAQTEEEAASAIDDMLSGNGFGEAGHRVVIEEFLPGEEASFIVIADGSNFLPFASCQDHKRAYDGDTGPNTGGMGAYSPAPVVTEVVHQRIIEAVIEPTIAGMASEGIPYTGFLYAGLMISSKGEPKVIEFNCRFGDPETQPIMMRLQSDLVALCNAAIDGNLLPESIAFDDRPALTAVMASGGYPGSYKTGDLIQGLSVDALASSDRKVFHAGTSLTEDGIVTAGGRVLGVTAMGSTVADAQARVYQMIDKITFKNREFRSDIGYRALERETQGTV